MPTKSIHFDSLKAISVIAVIAIHVTTTHLYKFDLAGTWQANLNLFFNQVFRFSVPLFVALSGFGLTKKYLTTKLALGDYFFRRAGKILPWYFFASLLIFLSINLFFAPDKVMYVNQPLWKIFLLGKADYHLYFVPMILQLYFLFPVLFYFLQKSPKLLLGLALLFQIGLYLYISQHIEIPYNYNNIWPDQEQYFWFYSWIFYFVLGMFLAKKQRLLSYFPTLLLTTILITGFLWSEVDMFRLLNFGIDTIVATRFTRLPVLLYATGFILISLSFVPKILSKLSYLGRLSYPTYLFHTLVLRFFLTFTPLLSTTPLAVSSLVIIATSFLTAGLLQRANRLLLAPRPPI